MNDTSPYHEVNHALRHDDYLPDRLSFQVLLHVGVFLGRGFDIVLRGTSGEVQRQAGLAVESNRISKAVSRRQRAGRRAQ